MDGSENTVLIRNDDVLGLGLQPSSPPQPDDDEKLSQEWQSIPLDPLPDAEKLSQELQSVALDPHLDAEKLSQELQSIVLEQHQTVVEESEEDKKEEDKKEGDDKEDESSDSNGEVKASDDDEEPFENLEDESEAKDDKSPWFQYPVRPDAVDCSFYLRTGTCKFGSNCKFNHPIRRKNQVSFRIDFDCFYG